MMAADGAAAVRGWKVVAEAFTTFIPEGSAASSGDLEIALCAAAARRGLTRLTIKPSIMRSSRLYQRLNAWFHAHRPLRWVETIATDYSDWSPLD